MSDIKNVRIEEDLLGTKEVSNDLYYGVKTICCNRFGFLTFI